MENTAPVSAPEALTANTESVAPKGQPKPGEGPSPVTPEKSPEKHAVTVNGKTRYYTTEELKQRASLADGSYERLEEASKILKQVQSRDTRFKETPEEVFDYLTKELGHDAERVRSAMEKYYKAKFIDPEEMTPEQKRIAELEEENRKFKSEREKEESERRTKAEQEEFNKELELTQKELIEAMEKAGLARDKFNLSRVAFHYRNLASKGIEPTPERVAIKVNEEFDRVLTSRVDRCKSPDELVALLGDKVVEMIRQYDIQKLKQSDEPKPQPKRAAKPKAQSFRHISPFTVWNE